jgi:hypothetical protein
MLTRRAFGPSMWADGQPVFLKHGDGSKALWYAGQRGAGGRELGWIAGDADQIGSVRYAIEIRGWGDADGMTSAQEQWRREREQQAKQAQMQRDLEARTREEESVRQRAFADAVIDVRVASKHPGFACLLGLYHRRDDSTNGRVTWLDLT